ncbi:MAG: hypothetical protein SFT94_12660 [Pseudanabaenaceae cyanobacterium bins.68]|nr:hypothetical protein [Pseudanabaenaceae cyanobacterium bins.68]
MAIITLRAWYVPEYEPQGAIQTRPHDLRLAKNSLLKSALRADFLDESQTVKDSEWFQRYLNGEQIEFYIEGSGSYLISNIDLISHEIYFTKQDSLVYLEPTIFYSYQSLNPESSDQIRTVITAYLEQFNQTARVKISLEQPQRTTTEPVKLKSSQMTRLRRSLLLIADVSAIATLKLDGEEQQIPSPQVCVEVGYALQAKRPDQILLVQMDGENPASRVFPFELPIFQRLNFKDEASLAQGLPKAIAQQLERFKL